MSRSDYSSRKRVRNDYSPEQRRSDRYHHHRSSDYHRGERERYHRNEERYDHHKRRRTHTSSHSSSHRKHTKSNKKNVSELRMTCGSVYNYKYLQAINEGAFGVVFLGEDQHGVKVAIKKLKINLNDESSEEYTFLREIDNLKVVCDHENVVKLLEVVKNKNEEIFLVFEYCEYDLKSLINDHFVGDMKTMNDVAVIKSLMVQLLKGLNIIHSKGLLHRDIKPENLLITRDGILKIADFGSSIRMKKEGSYTPGLVTLRYRAPEIFLGDKNYTSTLDLWSAGCILAELLLGKPLLDGTSELEQIDKMCTILGSPSILNWPGFKNLPNAKTLIFPVQPVNYLRKHIPNLNDNAYHLLTRLLTYDPVSRITAADALEHPYFKEDPLPSDGSFGPIFDTLEIIQTSPVLKNGNNFDL